MRDLWIRSVEFLDKVLREGGCVAVHCAQGVTCLLYYFDGSFRKTAVPYFGVLNPTI